MGRWKGLNIVGVGGSVWAVGVAEESSLSEVTSDGRLQIMRE